MYIQQSIVCLQCTSMSWHTVSTVQLVLTYSIYHIQYCLQLCIAVAKVVEWWKTAIEWTVEKAPLEAQAVWNSQGIHSPPFLRNLRFHIIKQALLHGFRLLGWSVNLIHSYLCKFMGKCSIGHPSASVPILGPITSQFKFPRGTERERDNPGHRMDTGWHSSWQNDAWKIFYSPAISKFALEQSFIIGVPTWTSVTVATQMKEELQEVNTLTTYDHLYIRIIRSWFCRFEEGGMQNFGTKSWKLKALDKYRSLCVSTNRLLYRKMPSEWRGHMASLDIQTIWLHWVQDPPSFLHPRRGSNCMSLASHFFKIYEKYTENMYTIAKVLDAFSKKTWRSSVFIAKESHFETVMTSPRSGSNHSFWAIPHGFNTISINSILKRWKSLLIRARIRGFVFAMKHEMIQGFFRHDWGVFWVHSSVI